MRFLLEDLLRASAELMGKSTYGNYYKAILEDGDEVAVMRMGGELAKNQREVKDELNFLGEIRHENLLTIRAYYMSSDETLFVYDYMPKGSLAAFLHDRKRTPVDWSTRMKIAKGVAKGLLSLHTHHNIIHGNLTSSNVLLDNNINPKISDFGFSELITIAPNSNVSATAGVLGYQAPELSKLPKADTKTDIYSLGVIMLELLTGKSPGEVELPKWVQMTVREEWVSEVIVLELLGRNTSLEKKMDKMLQLAMDCVSTLPQGRPDVHLVLQQLEEISLETAPSSSDDGGAGPSLS
ncbi:putative protein kinase RLK-Pelle-LRR-III family [Helianthus annuus]|nr:putative protein kinase RLK-Pelle-LRR-III family [Helianthus annuus]